jgi:hypothetical protein
MLFWLVLKLEIRNRVIYYLERFFFPSFFLLEDFLKIIYFCMVKCLSFYNSFFALRYFLM